MESLEEIELRMASLEAAERAARRPRRLMKLSIALVAIISTVIFAGSYRLWQVRQAQRKRAADDAEMAEMVRLTRQSLQRSHEERVTKETELVSSIISGLRVKVHRGVRIPIQPNGLTVPPTVDRICLTFHFLNTGPRQVTAVKGIMHFNDVFGDEVRAFAVKAEGDFTDYSFTTWYTFDMKSKADMELVSMNQSRFANVVALWEPIKIVLDRGQFIDVPDLPPVPIEYE